MAVFHLTAATGEGAAIPLPCRVLNRTASPAEEMPPPHRLGIPATNPVSPASAQALSGTGDAPLPIAGSSAVSTQSSRGSPGVHGHQARLQVSPGACGHRACCCTG